MKVVIVNGSPHKGGNCSYAIKLMERGFTEHKIDVKVLHVGNKKIQGCMACYKCYKMNNGTCTIDSDKVNEWIKVLKKADGIILVSPVYFAGVAGTMKSFLDRVFLVSAANGNLFRHKVGAAFVALRRSGGISTFNELNHYLSFSEMFIASSNYWNIGHGNDPDELKDDGEAIQIIRLLTQNMVCLLKAIDWASKESILPKSEEKIFTNFIK